MDTFLAPVEQPKSLMMKLAYYFTRKQFGKVLAPLKVHAVRLPVAFGMFYGKVNKLDKKLTLSNETILLVRQQVARLNICLFCMDIARWEVIRSSMDSAKFDALPDYASSNLFTPAEKALLDYTTALTQHKKVNPDTFSRMAMFYNETQICEVVWLIASEHLYNMTNIGLNIHSDMLCDMRRRSQG
ncbi:carboxymuconolactone decarboxylase family protein [Chitinophaga varians]|uniref:Carboxymuconolactone decarboxylase family protein n=1 Tax=Chitinophaga varians TaxID=2202339 RepID=A0A847RSQ2_9BACT|nr:carboxymuconolactone decarboxylase family protein [Chitinophaga varians]NLR63807.1 carboxymuconolactone decarboxylase family protein [Chitinophaga varians]